MSVQVAAFGERMTPEQVLRHALKDAGEMRVVVVVFEDDEGLVTTYTSSESSLLKLGMLSCAQDFLVRDMEEDE